MKQNIKLPKKQIVKWCVIVVAVYAVLVVALYFMMGEQLHFRNTRNPIELQQPSDGVVGNFSVCEQRFSTQVQRIKKVSVAWAEEQPTDTATVVLQLKNSQGEVLASQSCSVTKGDKITAIEFDVPLEGCVNVPLILTVSCNQNWVPEVHAKAEGQQLLLDGLDKDFCLNFAVDGQDYIWTGLNYWWIALGGFGVVCLIMVCAVLRYRHNNSSVIVNCFAALSKYRFLISQLVSRDFKTKYKRSFLGVVWSFLNPLLTTFVMYFVFSNVFRGWNDISNYTAYLIIGVTMFNFFNECCNMCLNSIVGNAHMITKVFVPKYIYPLTKTLSSGINFALALIPMFAIVLVNRLFPALSWILVLFPLACMMIFCFGLGMLLASSMVFFRDTQFLWGVISMLWMYLTPIFYPANIIPQSLIWVQSCNPMYLYINFVRTCIIGGVSPEPIQYVYCAVSALLMVTIGGLIFKKSQNSFVLYI